MVWPTFGSIECLDAALFCVCFTLSGMHGIYRRVWAGDREVTAWVHNRDRTPLPHRRRRERSPLARHPDAPERTIPHVPPSLSSRPRFGEPLSSGTAPRPVGEPLSSGDAPPRVGEPLSSGNSPRVRPLQPLDIVGAILSKGGSGQQMFREFGQALDIDGHKQLHESVVQITGSPNAGKSKTAEMICDILEVRRVPTTSKKYRKLVNPGKNFAVAHYTNDSFWDEESINWENFWRSFSSVAGTEIAENGMFLLEGHQMHETDKFNDHIPSTVHLSGPKSLIIARRTSKSLEDMTASVERYMNSHRRFPSSPTLILRAEDPADVNAFRIIAHEILISEFKDLSHGTAQFLSTASLADNWPALDSNQG